MSETMRAGSGVLDYKEADLVELVRVRVAEAIRDSRQPVPLDKAFAKVWSSIAKA